jgi:RimJ/RimL family protein N-acetyltransferase
MTDMDGDQASETGADPAAPPLQTAGWFLEGNGAGNGGTVPPFTGRRSGGGLEIGAERLTLQEVSRAAAADLRAGGTGGFAWIESGPFEGTADAAAMVVRAYEEEVHRPEWGMFVLVRREDGRAVGAMGFHGVPDKEGGAEVGYDLAENARGQGYATEALRALSEWALARDDVGFLFAAIDRDNAPSQRVVARAGFTRVSEEAERIAYELHDLEPSLRLYARGR